MFFILKLEKYILSPFQNKYKSLKSKLFFNYPKRRRTEITSKHDGDFCCLNFFIRLKQKNKLESHKNLCENKDFWNIVISSEYTKIKNTICYLCRSSIFDRKE